MQLRQVQPPHRASLRAPGGFARCAKPLAGLGLALVAWLPNACAPSQGSEAPSTAPAVEATPTEAAANETPQAPQITAEPAGPVLNPTPHEPATSPHAITMADIVGMHRIYGLSLSPDGRYLAFVRKVIDLAADRGRKNIWLLDVTSGQVGQLTHEAHEGAGSAWAPQWAPDGKAIYFVSTRSGSSQVWRQSLDGQPAQQVTDFPVAIDNLALSPTGAHLLFSAQVFPDCADFACTAGRLQSQAQSLTRGRAYERIFVRHWDTWKNGTRAQLFSLDLSGGQVVRLSRGLDADVPSSPFGGTEEFTISPDGRDVVFAARNAAGGNDEPRSTNFDLYRVAIDGSQAPQAITVNPAWDTHPSFSPDGSKLLYLAMARPNYESDRLRLMSYDWASGERREVARDWDRSVADFSFAPDGKSVFATAVDTGHRPVFRVDLESGHVQRLTKDGTVSQPTPHGDQLYYLKSDFRNPNDIWRLDLDEKGAPGQTRPLTAVNAPRLASLAMGEAEQLEFPGYRGEKVHAWVVKPANFDPAKRYPVAFLIHGGPQGSFYNRFHYRWNPQVYAGAGYAVVMVDFHGSTGYGQKFTDSINNDWGGKPLVDLKKGLAAATKKFPWMNGDQACALGASYGGYMINWIAGKWSDGFRCLVNHDGIFDNRSMYYSTEELWFVEWDHGGPYYERERAFEKFNPVHHVERWKTPMMVIHGALDHRVPLEQGLAAFTALQRRDIPSRLLYFPDENHWVLKPNNSLQWHEEVLKWLDQHLKPQAASGEVSSTTK